MRCGFSEVFFSSRALSMRELMDISVLMLVFEFGFEDSDICCVGWVLMLCWVFCVDVFC